MVGVVWSLKSCLYESTTADKKIILKEMIAHNHITNYQLAEKDCDF